jgi:anti-sigma regulatory factor (Ser/Thr protein kinase)
VLRGFWHAEQLLNRIDLEVKMPLYEIDECLDWAEAVDEENSATSARTGPTAMAGIGEGCGEFTFVLPNDQASIPPVVEFLAAEAARVAGSDAMEQMRISLALEEALVNALYHGNLEINSDSGDSQQMCRHDVAELRRYRHPYCQRRIHVFARIARGAAAFVIRDQGLGFDPNGLLDPTDEGNLGRASGRGVFLMRSLMDEVTFNPIGNQVTMVRRWSLD